MYCISIDTVSGSAVGKHSGKEGKKKMIGGTYPGDHHVTPHQGPHSLEGQWGPLRCAKWENKLKIQMISAGFGSI